MKNFNIIAKMPEVYGAALSDPAGVLIECTGKMDGRSRWCCLRVYRSRVIASRRNLRIRYTRTHFDGAGGKSACVIAVYDDAILGADVDPSKPLPSIEKKDLGYDNEVGAVKWIAFFNRYKTSKA